MHIFRRHQSKAPTLEKAMQISAEVTKRVALRQNVKPLGRITLHKLKEFCAESWAFPGVGDNTRALLAYLNVDVQAEKSSLQP